MFQRRMRRLLYDKKNEFNIEQFLSRRLKLKAGDEFIVVDAD